ncbi:unnamed protein product, partial [Durusdinium trenchii]
MPMWRCACFEGLWREAEKRDKPQVLLPVPAPDPEPSEVRPSGEADDAPVRSRRKSRTYSKMSSFVPEEPDELDDIADMWRYYALVAEKQVQTATRRLVEGSTETEKVQVPTRRSVIRGEQLLQNSMLQYLSYTVLDTIEKGRHGLARICPKDPLAFGESHSLVYTPLCFSVDCRQLAKNDAQGVERGRKGSKKNRLSRAGSRPGFSGIRRRNTRAMVKCYVCGFVEVDKKPGEWRSACERCAELLKAPPCKACGQPVRDAKKNESHPYHEECRRCSSCNQKISRQGMHCTAGKILCGSCDDLFGEFFVPGKRNGAEYMREAFKAWDEDSSGWIDTGELRRVLKAIMPNFSDRDINDLLRVIDTNANGVVEYEEFCAWLMKENPLDFSSSTFAAYVAQLMREAGTAKEKADLNVDEIQVRHDGVYFRLKSGQMRFETTAFRTEALALTALDPEEFISKVECVEEGLKLSFNTGRMTTLQGQGELFGPFEAPMGFYIDGLRVKPLDEPHTSGVKDCVTGIDVAPLPSASEYDCPHALLYTAEQEYLRSLREILAKSAVDVNTFGAGGVTALMLAASRGCTGAMRLLLSCKANANLADRDGWTALTYASRCGSPEAVAALLEKGAKEDKNDGGRALKEALRVKHNAAARALLRAGFGPAPAGTFALEGTVKPEDCKLAAPKILPEGGAFAQPRKVSILVGEEDAAKGSKVKVLYTLDGRDPYLCGQRYMGPITVTSRMQLRAVALQGPKRSQSVEATFLICHCALPDEIIFGTLQAQIFPAALDLLLDYTAETLSVSSSQFQVKSSEADSTTPRWVQVDLHDVKPRHQLHFDLAYASVKSADQRKKWTDAITNDIQKAVGEEPLDCKVFAGSIILEFQMTRPKADELNQQLVDPSSWLLTKAKHRKAFKNASLQVVEALGQRVSQASFRSVAA